MKLKNASENIIVQCIFVVFMLMFCINVTYSIFNFSYYAWIPVVVDSVVIFIAAFKHTNWAIKKIYKDMFYQFFLPLIVPSIVSAITAVAVYHDTEYIMSSFKRVLFVYGAYFLGYILMEKFKFKAFYLVLIAGTLSYFTVICKAVIVGNAYMLEVHELTYIYGMLFVFFLLINGISIREKILLCGICVIGMVLGSKRALWLAVSIALLVYLVFHKLLHLRKKGLKVVVAMIMSIGFLWIWMIKSGTFELICNRFGINDMSRLKMWNYFKNDYNLSIMYAGRGLTYTDVVMSKVHGSLGITTAIPIHNAILKMYIGWGFLPFAYYLCAFLYMRVTRMEGNGYPNNMWVFLSVSLVFYIIKFLF